MKKSYQKKAASAATTTEVVMPEIVSLPAAPERKEFWT